MNLPGLTGVRGVAAVWVLSYHLQLMGPYFGLPAIYEMPVLRAGAAGVDLFFVLSGFVLMLAHGQDFKVLQWEPTRRFFALRVLRIYPIATVVLLLILALVLVDQAFATQWLAAIKPNLRVSSFFRTLFLATRWVLPFDPDWNQPEWSLSVEIIGYAAFPVIALVSTRITDRRLLALLAAGCLLFPTILAVVIQESTYNFNYAWGALPRMAGAFTGGVLLARLHRLTPEPQRPLQGWLATAGLAALLVALLVPPWGYGLITPLLGLIVYGLAANRGAASGLFSSRVALWRGQVSFPLYLIQMVVLIWLLHTLGNAEPSERWVKLGLGLAFMFGFAWLLHVYVEQPIHRFARVRFARPSAARLSEALPTPLAVGHN